MSPGATFERVYLELKRKLGEGTWPPGTPLEPAILGNELAASITPVRDALHRLTGERLVEAPNHNGFRVPVLTEAALRDLYAWNGHLLALAIRMGVGEASNAPVSPPPPDTGTDARTAALFAQIARATGSGEHVRTIDLLNHRLGLYRRAEPQALGALNEEVALLALHQAARDHAKLAPLMTRYHQRRMKAVPDILAALCANQHF